MVRTRGTEAEPAGAASRTGSALSNGNSPNRTGSTTGNHSGLAVPAKTGLTNSGASRRLEQTGPLEVPSAIASMGLHAPAPTPGPAVQQFVTLGRYQLLSRLAVGGMAEVYLARQGELSGFKTLVVVKRVLPHLSVKPDFIAMFLDEARIASMLDHPNVVRVTEVGRAGEEYFLAMELVQGKSLTAMLQHGERTKTPLPHSLAALVVANAAAGLHHAHQLTDAAGNLLGLVHRDVSPQNIMVSFEGSVKVIDFGIARALGRLGDTNAGALKGKLGYMAPEQARGDPVDARADIFSLGVVLWECLAGRRLFLRENDLATLRAIIYEPIPKVSTYAKTDPALEVIVEHMVSRSLDERFQTAEEVRLALERWVFAAGGASTHDLAALMKSWFAADHLQWQKAARLALDMQESDPPMDLAFPGLAAGKSGYSTAGASRSGRFGLSPSANIAMPALIMPANTGLAPSKSRWVLALFALAVAVGAGFFGYRYWARQQQAGVGAESSPTGPVRPPVVETLPTTQDQSAKGKGPPSAKEVNLDQGQAKAGDSQRGLEQASTTSATESQATKRKNRVASGEKHAIMPARDEAQDTRPKRPNGSDSKPKSEPRPNPF